MSTGLLSNTIHALEAVRDYEVGLIRSNVHFVVVQENDLEKVSVTRGKVSVHYGDGRAVVS